MRARFASSFRIVFIRLIKNTRKAKTLLSTLGNDARLRIAVLSFRGTARLSAVFNTRLRDPRNEDAPGVVGRVRPSVVIPLDM